MKGIIKMLRETIFNRVTLFTVLIHWILVIIAFYERGWSRDIHFTYEPWVSLIILLLDLPAITIAESISIPLNTLIQENYPLNGVLVFVLIISAQWLMIGCMIKQLFLHRKKLTRQIINDDNSNV